MKQKHLEALFAGMKFGKDCKPSNKRTKRLISVLNKLYYGAMSTKQIADKHELMFEQQRDHILDWGDG